MKKNNLIIIAILMMNSICWSQGFKVSGSQLLDANGNNFVIKGMNVPLAWFVADVNNNIANIKTKTGANCLRIVVTTSTSDNAWQTCVQNCIDNKIVPMVELHDVTGNNSPSELNRMATFWASKSAYLKRPEIAKYILINIANEWSDWYMSANGSGTVSRITWRDAYITAVKTIRNAGITTALVVDAAGYGQDNKAQTILSYAKEVQNADPQHNCLFSVHMYCEWSVNGNSSVTSLLPSIKNAGIPIIVGEFGFQHSEGNGICDINESQIINTANSSGIGWLAWSWKGNGGGVEYLDLSSDWAGNNLSSWGATVVNGNGGTKTAVNASIFSAQPNTPPTISLIAPINNSTFLSPASIIISANAADANGTISKVEFYNGTTLIGSDATSPYSFTWTNVPVGTYSIRAKATDNEGAFTTSTSVTVSVSTVIVNTPPKVSLTAPATNSSFSAPATIIISANASDANGSVSSVQFYNGTTLIGSDVTSPYSFSWLNVGAGTYTITARAIDNEGAVSIASAITLVVSNFVGDILGVSCGVKNGSSTFELSPDKRVGANSISWWFTGSANSVVKLSSDPYKAVVNYSIYYTGGDVCASVNYSVAPWYKQYCKSIGVCGAKMDASFSDDEIVKGQEISITPNPSSNSFAFTLQEDLQSLIVVNELGVKVFSEASILKGEQFVFGENFPAGLYTLIIQYPNGNFENRRIQKVR